MLTFAVSLLWIAFYSYMLVWWATIVGDVVSFLDSGQGLGWGGN